MRVHALTLLSASIRMNLHRFHTFRITILRDSGQSSSLFPGLTPQLELVGRSAHVRNGAVGEDSLSHCVCCSVRCAWLGGEVRVR